MGLYGNVIVVPAEPDYWPPVHREVALTLDDILIEDGQVAAFSRSETTYAAMGRFGNVLLVAGEPELALTAKAGEVVRFYLTNTANTRVFKVALPGARMKLVGGDSGRCEREAVRRGRRARAVGARGRRRALRHAGRADAGAPHARPDLHAGGRRRDRGRGDAVAGRGVRVAAHRPGADGRARTARRRSLDAPPDKTLAFVAEMDMGEPDVGGRRRLRLPDAPGGRQRRARALPECGMKLIAEAAPTGFACPMHPEVTSETAGPLPAVRHEAHPGAARPHGRRRPRTATRHEPRHDHADAGGIEWEDDMVEVNKLTTPENMRWKLVDRSDDAENHAIDWQFRVGDRVKIRLVNEMDSDHPMHHPFHIHGAGRFLVLARDGAMEPNLVWSDTVLVRTGETVDIVLDVTNVGRWMAHCHIAEHHESGMMFSLRRDGMTSPRRAAATKQLEVVIIGGGQAGLAIGYFLRAAGRRFTILEAAGEPAAAWRARWDSLKLFTPGALRQPARARRSPASATATRGATTSSPTSPTTRSASSCRSSSTAAFSAVRPRDGGGFVVELADRTYEADQVVVATGPFQVPFTPPWPRTSATRWCSCTAARTAHRPTCRPGRRWSSAAATPGTRSPRSSCASRPVHLAVGARQTPLPQRILGRDLFRYLEATGLMGKTVDSRLAQRLKDRETLIGSSPRGARKQGIHLRPRATAAHGRTVTFADGSQLAVDAVVWATGFRLDHSFVRLPGVRRARAGQAPARGDRGPRLVLPRAAVAAHARVGAARAGSRTTPEFIAERIAAAASAAAVNPQAAITA